MRAPRAWSALVDFVAETEDAASLALVRIFLGGTLFLHVAHFLVSGAASAALVGFSQGGMARESTALGALTTTGATGLCIALAVSAACVCIGLCTRIATVAAWLLMQPFMQAQGLAHGAYDNVFINGLFVLVLSGAGRALSVDARLWLRSSTISRWPRVLLVFQLGWLYLGSALAKIGAGWVPGGDASALWFTMQSPSFGRTQDGLPLWAYPITQVMTTSVWLWELCGPLLVVAIVLHERRAGGPVKRLFDRIHLADAMLGFGVLMHIGIDAFLEVGPFSAACLSLYFAGVAPARWRAWWVRVRRTQMIQ